MRKVTLPNGSEANHRYQAPRLFVRGGEVNAGLAKDMALGADWEASSDGFKIQGKRQADVVSSPDGRLFHWMYVAGQRLYTPTTRAEIASQINRPF